jgi:hypothetical protein
MNEKNHLKINLMNKQKLVIDVLAKIQKAFPEYAELITSFTTGVNQKQIIKNFKTPILIIAGGASLMNETKVNEYHNMLLKLMSDFKGTIISGGTTAGIPGLVGQVKTKLEQNKSVGFDLLGYLPQNLPGNVSKSNAFDYLFETDSNDFSVLEVLNYWIDIILSENEPKNVILFGIDGGAISMLEYKIALLLEAKVCLVEGSGRAADELLRMKDQYNYQNLFGITDMPLNYNSLLSRIHKTNHFQ